MLNETTLHKLETLSHYAIGDDQKALKEALAALKDKPVLPKKVTRRELVQELERIARDSEFVSIEQSLHEAGTWLVKYIAAPTVNASFRKIKHRDVDASR